MPDVSLNGISFEIKGSTDKASDSISKLINQLGSLKSSISKSGNVGKFTDSMKQIDKSAKSANKSMGKLTSAVLRVGFYRVIRSAIKSVGDAFKEGLTNAYQFSKLTGGELASSLDLIATKSLTMKNQMGATFGGLIVEITPVVVQLIKIVNAVAAAITRLIAIISGKTTWLRAKDVWTEWGEAATGAGAAAKKALKYLAPFDELNRLPDDNARGGHGGNAIPDYSEMFEEVSTDVGAGLFDTITEAFRSLADWFQSKDWQNVGEQAFETLKSIFGDVGKASELVDAFFNALGSAFGAVLGFAWGFLKSAAEDIFKTFKENIRDYDGDNKISLVDILTAALNTAVSPIQWIDNNIIKPFWRGFTQTLFGEEIEPITTSDVLDWIFKNLNDQAINGWVNTKLIPWFTEGMRDFATDASLALTGMTPPDLKAWLSEGWQDFKTELYNIFIKPIVDIWDEFIANHPKIAKLLGLSQSSGSVFPNNGETFSFDVEGTITDIKDNIPTEKKTLKNFIAGLFGTKDEIPAADKKTSGWQAVLNSFTPKFASGAADSSGRFPLLSAFVNLSNYTTKFGSSSPTADSSKKFPLLQAVANLSNYNTGFKSGTADSAGKFPLIGSVANMSNYQTKFASGTADSSGKFPLFASVAKFTTKQDGLTDANKTFSTKANFTSSKTGWTNNPVLGAIANFISGSAGWRDDPYLSAVASFIDYADNIEGTPEIACKGVILDYETNNPGYVMGSYAKGGAFYGGSWHDIPQAASGGNFHGTMFWAGENGPEVVGHAGGRTEVLNRSQLAATMYAAVSSALSGIQMRVTGMGAAPMTGAGDESMSEDVLYRAMLRALNDSDAFPDEISLDGATVYKKMVQRNRMERARTGMNPMLSY